MRMKTESKARWQRKVKFGACKGKKKKQNKTSQLKGTQWWSGLLNKKEGGFLCLEVIPHLGPVSIPRRW